VSEKPIGIAEGRIPKAEGVDRRPELSRLHPSRTAIAMLASRSEQLQPAMGHVRQSRDSIWAFRRIFTPETAAGIWLDPSIAA
jgi:hypothetical protein